MHILGASPLFKLTLALCLGIFCAEHLGRWPLLFCIGFIPIYLLLLRWDRRWISPLYERMLSAALYLGFVGLGAGWWLCQPSIQQAPLESYNCQEQCLALIIGEKVSENTYGWRAEARIWGMEGEEGINPLSGKIMLSCQKRLGIAPPQAYDSIYGRIYVHTFNSAYPSYTRYLNRRQIYHGGYVQSLLRTGRAPLPAARLHSLRGALGDQMASLLPQGSGMARAMLLGEKQDLSEDTQAAFAAAGLSHILAISGLHVGIIFGILEYLFSFFRFLRSGRVLKNILILFLLLLYMLLAGASPAVVRAVMMFGTFLLFRSIYRRYQVLNVLALSALLQLLWDPAVLFSVGFQLSYSAVIGLVCFYPAVQSFSHTGIWWLDSLYGWIGVTLVATVCTAPLVWGYFGQFPTWFVLSNVLVSLVVVCAVGLGFMLMICCWIPGLNVMLGWATAYSLYFLESIGCWVAALPHAVIHRWAWDEPGVWCLVGELGVVVGLYLGIFLYRRGGEAGKLYAKK